MVAERLTVRAFADTQSVGCRRPGAGDISPRKSQLDNLSVREATESRLTNLFDRIDLGPAIERGLRAIQAEYREAVILVDIEGCTYADAAAALGVPVGTVRSRLFRGRRLLQQTLIAHARDMGFAEPAAARSGDERVLT